MAGISLSWNWACDPLVGRVAASYLMIGLLCGCSGAPDGMTKASPKPAEGTPSLAEPGQLDFPPTEEQSEPDPALVDLNGHSEQGLVTERIVSNGMAAIEPPALEMTIDLPGVSNQSASSGVLDDFPRAVPQSVGGVPRDLPAPPSRIVSANAPEPDGDVQTNKADRGFSRELVYYATDRGRSGRNQAAEFFTAKRGELEYGVCEVSIPYLHQPGEMESRQWYEWKHDPARHIVMLDPLTTMSEAAWIARMRSKLGTATQRDVLVFVHGYNVSFEGAVRRTAQLSYDLNFPGAAVCYSWPAGNQLNYANDWTNAEWSVPHCQHVLRQIALYCRAERVHLIAHSMGSRVLTFALKDLASDLASLSSKPLFNQVVLAAPDIDADTFRTQIAPAISRASQRLTIYASNKDKALDLSRELNGYARLGTAASLAGQADMLGQIECVDATDLFDDSWLNLRHAYYGDSPVLISDLRRVLAGQTARERGLASSDDGRYQIR